VMTYMQMQIILLLHLETLYLQKEADQTVNPGASIGALKPAYKIGITVYRKKDYRSSLLYERDYHPYKFVPFTSAVTFGLLL